MSWSTRRIFDAHTISYYKSVTDCSFAVRSKRMNSRKRNQREAPSISGAWKRAKKYGWNCNGVPWQDVGSSPTRSPTPRIFSRARCQFRGVAFDCLRPKTIYCKLPSTQPNTATSAPGLRLHTDVDRIVRAQAIDWDRLLALTASLKVKTATYFSLEIPRQICGTPIPADVCDHLAPPKLQRDQIVRFLRRAGLFHPNQPKFGRLGYMVFTSLLYDDWKGWRQAIVPRRQWMRERYGEHAAWQLPWLHARRIANLLFRRLST